MIRPVTQTLLFCIASICFSYVACYGQSSEKPNIIYILADDLGYADLGAYGQDKIKTPNLDQMAAEGMRFTQHYAGSTVCAPSRSVLMTGLHTGHSPIRGNKEIMPVGQYPLPYGIPTIAEVVKEAGYTTAAFGKWGLGYPGSEGSPAKQGFDYFYGNLGQRRAHFYYPEFLYEETLETGPKRVALEGNVVNSTARVQAGHRGAGHPIKREVYSQDAIMERVCSFLDEKGQTKKPFFLYLPFNLPHASLTVPKRAMKPYLNASGKSIFKEEPYEGGGYTPQPKPYATYAAMVTLLDSYVGDIMDKLKALDIAKNTLIIFTSDNGPHREGGLNPDFFNSNGPLRGGKRDMYEGGIRVPMIAWWLGKVKPGSTSDHISTFQDMMPTVAELSGVQSPPNIDGISIVPTLTGKGQQKNHEYLYWEFPSRGGKQAVRKGKWKAVRLNTQNQSDAPILLYDLSNDGGEQHDVADNYPDIKKQMRIIMDEAHVRSELFPLNSKDLESE